MPTPDNPVLWKPALRGAVKTGLRVWVRNHSAWKRFALVTDVEWVAKAMRMFTAHPGEVIVRDLDGLGEAKT